MTRYRATFNYYWANSRSIQVPITGDSTKISDQNIEKPSVRKQHNAGYKHKANVRSYYQQFEEQQTQSLIDQRIKEHLGQTAAFQQQVGANFHQHYVSLQSNPQRPRLPIPILPPPMLPLGSSQAPASSPLVPSIRPPVLARPIAGAPGYGHLPTMSPMVGPPGTSLSMHMNGLPRPPTLNPPTTGTGATGTPTSNGAGNMMTPAMYQSNPTAATTGGFDGYNISGASGLQRPTPGGATNPSAAPTASQDGFTYSQTSGASH